jgi:hypothetical protein
LPDGIGLIDRKHISIKCFPETGTTSLFFLILLAYADAYAFIYYCSCWRFWQSSDGSVFKGSAIGKMQVVEELLIPFPPSPTFDDSGEAFPYKLVVEEAFPLKRDFIRPYTRRMLTNKKHIFNYRPSRARKSVECASAILNAKFTYFRD